MKQTKYLIIAFMSFLPFLSKAEEAAPKLGFIETYFGEIVLGLTILVAIVVILAMFVMLKALKTVIRLKNQEQGIEIEEPSLIKVKAGEENVSFWGRFWNRMNNAVPVEMEASVATDHSYDGIRELDNRLPPWWLYGFYFTIIFGVIYLLYFHVLGGKNQHEEFQASMIQAEKDKEVYLANLDNLIDEKSVELLTDDASIKAGATIYKANCAVCHANDGGGAVGPNFTDKYWIHGGDIQSIFKTIKYGVPAKGMISWETQLSPKKMQQVASFVFSLEGTTPAKAKEPQGELFEREAGVTTAEEKPVEETVE